MVRSWGRCSSRDFREVIEAGACVGPFAEERRAVLHFEEQFGWLIAVAQRGWIDALDQGYRAC
ncbi:MAG: hypothetical protein RMJ98_05550 [Myxococcales bacterium]|nr:hypothetical protein [Polyangiaceae bacterium]MDW8248756.1 hypothetical protein [Myxococcales bacterium]